MLAIRKKNLSVNLSKESLYPFNAQLSERSPFKPGMSVCVRNGLIFLHSRGHRWNSWSIFTLPVGTFDFNVTYMCPLHDEKVQLQFDFDTLTCYFYPLLPFNTTIMQRHCTAYSGNISLQEPLHIPYTNPSRWLARVDRRL